jgi:hypothetical protein
MNRPRRFFAALTIGLALAGSPLSAVAAESSASGSISMDEVMDNASEGFLKFFDIVVLRPAGLARLAVGALFALPISSTINLLALPVGQSTSVFADDYDLHVVEPADYVFARPIGEDLAGR